MAWMELESIMLSEISQAVTDKYHMITVVLICISLMASNAEHSLICVWALCMPSLEKWCNIFFYTQYSSHFTDSTDIYVYILSFYFLICVFLLNLLGCHWLIKLYRFQVYDSIIHHLYIVLCVHHPKLNFLPSPFISAIPFSASPPPLPLVITILLPMSTQF